MNLDLAMRASTEIRQLAREAKARCRTELAQRIASQRIRRPMDYMRYAEFQALSDWLVLRPGMKVLDISSPQWLSILLARKNPHTVFNYINIIESELNPFAEIAHALDLNNVTFMKDDVRHLSHASATFDLAVSVSVIEHVFPEVGGDIMALSEVMRVLKRGGKFLMTVPYKETGGAVYVNGSVYERAGSSRTFFAREYDPRTFSALLDQSGFEVADLRVICERSGLFPLDYYEWGPGKNSRVARVVNRLRRLGERAFRGSLDGALAGAYLRVAQEPVGRLVNVAAKLAKE